MATSPTPCHSWRAMTSKIPVPSAPGPSLSPAGALGGTSWAASAKSRAFQRFAAVGASACPQKPGCSPGTSASRWHLARPGRALAGAAGQSVGHARVRDDRGVTRQCQRGHRHRAGNASSAPAPPAHPAKALSTTGARATHPTETGMPQPRQEQLPLVALPSRSLGSRHVLVHGSELTQPQAGCCQPPDFARASRSAGGSPAVAAGSPGTGQRANKQRFQLVPPLWEPSLQNQLSSWAYPYGHPGCSLPGLGKPEAARGEQGWEQAEVSARPAAAGLGAWGCLIHTGAVREK